MTTKIEMLQSAMSTLQSWKTETVTLDAIKIVGAAVLLDSVAPPKPMDGEKPLYTPGTDPRAPIGSWPHYIERLIIFGEREANLAELVERANQGDRESAVRAYIVDRVLGDCYIALRLALREEEAAIEATRRETERKEREARAAAEKAQREAADARARDIESLRQAVLHNAAAPKAAPSPKPAPTPRSRHPRLTVQRINSLLDKQATVRRDDQGMGVEDAKLSAARFVLGLVIAATRPDSEHTYTPNEIKSFKEEIKIFVSTVYAVKRPHRGAEALLEAEAWMSLQLHPARPERPAPESLSHRLDLSNVRLG